jgi:hypothetical protein
MAQNITIELTAFERDFILKHIWYLLSDELISNLKAARPDKQDWIKCKVNKYELESMIGNLSAESNHSKNKQVQLIAAELAEHLENYEARIS